MDTANSNTLSEKKTKKKGKNEIIIILSKIYERLLIKYTMSKTYQIPHGGYSNTDAAKSIEEKERRYRSTNYNNRHRSNNQPLYISLTDFTGKVPSFGSALGTVAENLSMKYQFKTFLDKVKTYVLREFDNQGTSSSLSRISRTHMYTIT